MSENEQVTEPSASAEPAKSGYQKGVEFEREFANFMRTHLKFSKVEERPLRPGADVVRAYECDLIGVKHSSFYRALEMGGMFSLLLTVALLVGVSVGGPDSHGNELKVAIENFVGEFVPELAAYSLVLIILVATFVGYLGSKRNKSIVLVECRNRKATVRRSYIGEVATRRRQILAGAKADKPSEVWIVSSSGFDQDAVNLATSEKLHCITFQRAPPTATLVNKGFRSRVLTDVGV